MLDKFKDRVVYEVYIKSFMDSNADGIGDIRGVINKLDYLEYIGVNSLWITPFYESPMKDEGYDISDYKKVNPDFGTLEDVKELIEKANEKGIDIMSDFVLNHTSDQHEWFQRALKGEKEYMDYYFFSDEPKTDWIPRFGGESCWEYVPSLDKYYLHLYDVSQPDLNWDNPVVRQKMFEVVDFWLSLGIKAYKFDVLYLISKPTDDWLPNGRVPSAEAVGDGKHVHEYIKEMMAKIKAKYPDTYSVGEMSFSSLEESIKYSRDDSKEIDIVQTGKILDTYPAGAGDGILEKPDVDLSIYVKNISYWVEGIQEGGGWLCTFTANHDSPRSVSKFGSLTHRDKSAKMLILHTVGLQGTPFFIQGDEIGMLNPGYDNLEDYVDIKSQNIINDPKLRAEHSDEFLIKTIDKNSRDSGRNPMVWDSSKNGGWSSSDKPWRKVMQHSIDSYSVEKNLNDKNSILHFFKDAVTLRKEDDILVLGDIKFSQNDPYVLQFTRTHKDKTYSFIFNFSDEERTIPATSQTEVLMSNSELNIDDDKIVLKPWDGFILK